MSEICPHRSRKTRRVSDTIARRVSDTTGCGMARKVSDTKTAREVSDTKTAADSHRILAEVRLAEHCCSAMILDYE